MPLSQFEKVVGYDEVPADRREDIMLALLDFLQLEIVAEQVPEGGDDLAYSVRRRADVIEDFR